MLVIVKLAADFSWGCAHPTMRPRISVTLPHPDIRGLFYASTHYVSGYLAAANSWAMLHRNDSSQIHRLLLRC